MEDWIGCYNRKLTEWVPQRQPLSTELTNKPLHTRASHLAGCFCQWNVLQPCCHMLMLLDLRESRDAELRTHCSMNRARFLGSFPTSFFRLADFVPNNFWEYNLLKMCQKKKHLQLKLLKVLVLVGKLWENSTQNIMWGWLAVPTELLVKDVSTISSLLPLFAVN